MANEKELVVVPDFPRYRINEVGVLYDTLECAVVPYFFSEEVGRYLKMDIVTDTIQTTQGPFYRRR